MLTAPYVAPLGAEPVVQPFVGLKEVGLALNRRALLCFCEAPAHAPPVVVRVFLVHELRIEDERVRWTIVDDAGTWFEGASQELGLIPGQLYLRPHSPVMKRSTPYGERVVFKTRLPVSHRIHHLAYLRRSFPSCIPTGNPLIR